jgi:hypothetical protein
VQWVMLTLLVVHLRRRRGPLGLGRVASASGKALLATIPAVALGYLALHHTAHILVLRLAAALVVTALSYLVAAHLLGLHPTRVLRRARQGAS